VDYLAEHGVIGSLLLDSSYLPQVQASLSPEDFATEQTRAVYQVMLRMWQEDQVIDAMTVSARCGVDQSWFVDVLDRTPTAHRCMDYVAAVRRNRQYGAIRELADSLVTGATLRKESPGEIIGAALDQLERIGQGRETGVLSNDKSLVRFLEHRQTLEGGGSITVPTGFPSLDRILGSGMMDTGLYILGARPGVGKTSLGLMIAEQAARTRPVLFVSLEMTDIEITCRRVSNISGVGIGHLLYGRQLRSDMAGRVRAAVQTLGDSRLLINRAEGATVADIELMAKSVRAELVVIDYLGLIETQERYASSYERVSVVSRSLKRLARRLGCPILCLAQLNRQSESRESKRPQISDLRDSGAVEQDADGILLLHRPALYQTQAERPPDYKEQPFEVHVGKNRHGPTGRAVLQWIPYNGRFRDGSMCSWEPPKPQTVEPLAPDTPVPAEFEQLPMMGSQ
jgi:replicative DNA helicase